VNGCKWFEEKPATTFSIEDEWTKAYGYVMTDEVLRNAWIDK
jgi:hypothetical protein